MDASSIITQVSRDDEQLNSYQPENGTLRTDNNDISTTQSPGGTSKKAKRGLLRSLLCCLGRGRSKGQNIGPPCVDGRGSPALCAAIPRFLLPPVRHQDMHKKCMVIDLDETLVHSSFKPISNADFIVPVEIDGTVHQVYVLKRPYVDDFLQRMGELYECVLFTASLAKYADPVADLLDRWGCFRARLFRESCVFHRGNYVKDLNKLGRDLQQVVIVDNSPASYIFHPDNAYADPVADLLDRWGCFRARLFRESCVFHRGNYVKALNKLGRDLQQVVIVDNSPASYIFHPDNAVPVASWFDDMTDSELLDLIPFFEKLGKMDNVYTVLCNSNRPYNCTSPTPTPAPTLPSPTPTPPPSSQSLSPPPSSQSLSPPTPIQSNSTGS